MTGDFDIGPSTARLLVRTGREGVASKVGHDLTITFADWSGHVDLPDGDPARARVRVVVRTSSIEVLGGSGGIAPLFANDRAEITRTARRLLEVDRHPEAVFESTTATVTSTGGTLAGQVTIRGVTAPITLDVVDRGDGQWHARTSLLQSSFGIKPHRAFLGALRVADQVQIEVDIPEPS